MASSRPSKTMTGPRLVILNHLPLAQLILNQVVLLIENFKVLGKCYNISFIRHKFFVGPGYRYKDNRVGVHITRQIIRLQLTMAAAPLTPLPPSRPPLLSLASLSLCRRPCFLPFLPALLFMLASSLPGRGSTLEPPPERQWRTYHGRCALKAGVDN